MAVLLTPVPTEIIQRGIGVLDYYVSRGQWIVRRWPRPSRYPPTPAQTATRARFGAARRCPVVQSLAARTLINRLPTRPIDTRLMYLLSVSIRSHHLYDDFDPLFPTGMRLEYPEEPYIGDVDLLYDPSLIHVESRMRYYQFLVGDPPGPEIWQQAWREATPGNPAHEYYRFPLARPDRRITDVQYHPTAYPPYVHLGVHNECRRILGYYRTSTTVNWLMWALPRQTWNLSP